MITPEIISPIIPGIFNLRNKIGERSIISNISEKTKTGFFSGKANSSSKCRKNSIMLYNFSKNYLMAEGITLTTVLYC